MPFPTPIAEDVSVGLEATHVYVDIICYCDCSKSCDYACDEAKVHGGLAIRGMLVIYAASANVMSLLLYLMSCKQELSMICSDGSCIDFVLSARTIFEGARSTSYTPSMC